MTTLVILIILIVIGIFLMRSCDYDFHGFMMCLVFGFWLVMHLIAWSLSSYEYGLFLEKRNAFEQTLNEARKNGNEYETAAIVKEVAEWNQKLAEIKYDNKTLFYDQYIDDRIEMVKPIK